jgi:hypothetical protein
VATVKALLICALLSSTLPPAPLKLVGDVEHAYHLTDLNGSDLITWLDAIAAYHRQIQKMELSRPVITVGVN